MARERVVHDDTVNAAHPMSFDEIGKGQIEQVTENDIVTGTVALEAFMNEVLTINVFHGGSDNDLPVTVPGVNGISQPIVRGVPTKVKRKYVEVLARSHRTGYDQRQEDPTNKASLKMVSRPKVSYPFAVIHDPNPRGAAWLDGIMAERH